MKTFNLIGQANLIFTAQVKAETLEQAMQKAEHNFGMTCTGNQNKDECIVDWDVPMKPDVEILGKRLKSTGDDYREELLIKKFNDEDATELVTVIYDKSDDSFILDRGGDSLWFTKANWEKIVQMGTLVINSAK